jgi:outer membrane protein with beta-barrel domain
MFRKIVNHAQAAVMALVLTHTIAPAALAGASPERPWHPFITGGLTVAEFRNVPDPLGIITSMKSGAVSGGISLDLGMGLAIEPAVLFVAKGVSFGGFEAADAAGNLTGKFTVLHVINHIEFPILLRYRIPVGERFRPSLALGPFVSFEHSEKFKTTGVVEESTDADEIPNSDKGLTVGAGLAIPFGPGQALIDARYDFGLANLVPTSGARSGAFLLMAGYRY